MKAGVYTAYKKNGELYFRASLTHSGKHISLGSFTTEDLAHLAYQEGLSLLSNKAITLLSFCESERVLSYKKWVSLINFRDNKLYIKTPIYLKKHYFHYYFNPEEFLVFDVDDLFYYSTHSIMRRGGHYFVSDYGMQVSILSRYGIKPFAVPGKDYFFINGDGFDFRYHNLEIINKYQGVVRKPYLGGHYFETKIHVNGYLLVGRYKTEIEAAIAYNKAASTLIRKGINKNFLVNYIEELNQAEYHNIFREITIKKSIIDFPQNKEPYKPQ